MTLGRRIFATAAVGLLVAAALGAPARAEGIDLRMTIWSANEAHLRSSTRSPPTTKGPSGRDVTFDSLPFDGYTTTLTTQIAGGNAPDLAWIFETTAADFVNSGALVPLRTFCGRRRATIYATSAQRHRAVAPGRRALRLSVLDLALRHVRQQRPDQEAGAKTPAELIAAGEWTWDNAMQIAAAVACQSGKQGLSSATSTTRSGTIWPRSGAAGAPRPGAPTARPAPSTSRRWSTR